MRMSDPHNRLHHPVTGHFVAKDKHPFEPPRSAVGLALLLSIVAIVAVMRPEAHIFLIAVCWLSVVGIGWLCRAEFKHIRLTILARKFDWNLLGGDFWLLIVFAVTGLFITVYLTAGEIASRTVVAVVPEPAPSTPSRDLDDLKKSIASSKKDAAYRAAQIAKLEEIDNFIGSRDEPYLREMFDLSNMFYYNLEMVRDGLINPKKDSPHSKYFEGGAGFIDKRFLENGNNVPGELNYRTIGIAEFGISKKYNESYNKLKSYENDAIVPESIKSTLRMFDIVVDQDKNYTSDVINVFQIKNKKYILDIDKNTPMSGAAISTYNVNTQNLQKPAEQVNHAIHDYIYSDQ
jgi:hypothetical protein